MTRRTLVVLATVWLIVGVVAVGPLWAKPVKAAAGALGFTLEDQTGKEVNLADFAGKIVVLEWINPDCPVSRSFYTNGKMKALATECAAKGVVWLAINTTDYWTNAKNKAWVDKNKLPYPILNDQSGKVGRAYGAKTTPDMRVIDKAGKLAYSGAIDGKGAGGKKVNFVAQAVGELLAGKKVSRPKTRPYGCSVKYAKPVKAAAGALGFTLEDQTGKKVNLADFAGKIVVLEWINPDCPVSKGFYTNGKMKALATDLAAKGVVWLAVNTTHYWTNDKNKDWVTKYELPYPILNDQSGKVGRAYGAKTTPDMRVIDKAGKLAYSGAIDGKGAKGKRVNLVAQAVEELLAGKKVSKPKTNPYGCSVKYAPKKSAK
ncbi:MAG TPA: redoxin domain-containing protein [Phycisphaerae bacterium]|nr:redoxin domain-containing protein [Phycisphaerae bacterium]